MRRSLHENVVLGLAREPGDIRECWCGAVIRREGGVAYGFVPGFAAYVEPWRHVCPAGQRTATLEAQQRPAEAQQSARRVTRPVTPAAPRGPVRPGGSGPVPIARRKPGEGPA